MSTEVWVWAEHYRGELLGGSPGLIGKARRLCQQLGGGEVASVLFGDQSQRLASELVDHGSDRVYLADDPALGPFDTELRTNFMTKLIQSHQPEIVLWGTSSLERETAARVAARLRTGLTAHCLDLYIEEVDGKPQLITVVAGWGGNVSLKIICPEKRPVMATVNPGIFRPNELERRRGQVVPVAIEDSVSRLEITEVVEQQGETEALEQAEVVVVGGWGLTCMGGFEAVEELAQVLGGTVAGTRPALDAGWITHERVIGQSGRIVAPRLLITLGVSGAPQFSTGVLSSGVILAIDRNLDAPIFEMADIGIVGDLREVLPLLIDRVRKIKRETQASAR